MRAYEKHCQQSGERPSHERAKEIIAGIAAAEADKLFETKGLDYLDRDTAKQQAVDQATSMYDQQYGSM
ncbi:hypothetical protein HK104_007372 [Borealophlyctis nickersoniae]|nr:hypothetical protein HK104_007372 [Borealophlyctis nickersoniae]